jgi:hypothetical protein
MSPVAAFTRTREPGADEVEGHSETPVGRQKLGNLLMKPSPADLLFLKAICEAGKGQAAD